MTSDGRISSFKGPDGQEDMPYLLSPGPVTTSRGVRFAALADWGPHDAEFQSIYVDALKRIKKMAGCGDEFVCVPVQGPGSFAVEAAIGSFCPSKRKKTLVVSNGAAAQRAYNVLQRLERPAVFIEALPHQALDPASVAAALDADRNISTLWLCHAEGTTGIVNPIAEITKIASQRGKAVIVDASLTFGAVPIHMTEEGIDALVCSASQCLEGLPGFSFVIARRGLVEAGKGESHSAALDLYDQLQAVEAGETDVSLPTTHLIVALRQALVELELEGGVDARLQRYTRNANVLRERLRAMGFSLLLSDIDASFIVQTVLAPRDAKFDFAKFQARLRAKGFLVSEGAMVDQDTFRIGTIGQVNDSVMKQLIETMEGVLRDMGVRELAPAKT
jgi:2-aminoethylphosphonate-pyruvate transaminase